MSANASQVCLPIRSATPSKAPFRQGSSAIRNDPHDAVTPTEAVRFLGSSAAGGRAPYEAADGDDDLILISVG